LYIRLVHPSCLVGYDELTSCDGVQIYRAIELAIVTPLDFLS